MLESITQIQENKLTREASFSSDQKGLPELVSFTILLIKVFLVCNPRFWVSRNATEK